MVAKSLGVALITGASQGIGKAIALRLAKDGFRVALNDIPSKEQSLKAVRDEIEHQTGGKACITPADVSNEKEVEQMVNEASKTLGGLDVMVANAGIAHEPTVVTDLSAEIWEKIFAVNIRGVFFCYKHAAREMIAQDRGGRIIGASSLAGIKGGSLSSAYTASKFAVRGLTQSAAAELGQYGITVNAYTPAIISTPLSKPFLEAGKLDMLLNIFGFSKPWGNFHAGEPEDVANVVSYLASKEAHYVTGQSLAINGGLQY
jgi:acetoin reductase-like protein